MIWKYINQIEKRFRIPLIVLLIFICGVSLIITIFSKSIKVGFFIFIPGILSWIRVLYLSIRYHRKQ